MTTTRPQWVNDNIVISRNFPLNIGLWGRLSLKTHRDLTHHCMNKIATILQTKFSNAVSCQKENDYLYSYFTEICFQGSYGQKIIIGFGHGLVPQLTSNYPNQWWPSVTMLGLVVGHKLGPQWVKSPTINITSYIAMITIQACHK